MCDSNHLNHSYFISLKDNKVFETDTPLDTSWKWIQMLVLNEHLAVKLNFLSIAYPNHGCVRFLRWLYVVRSVISVEWTSCLVINEAKLTLLMPWRLMREWRNSATHSKHAALRIPNEWLRTQKNSNVPIFIFLSFFLISDYFYSKPSMCWFVQVYGK